MTFDGHAGIGKLVLGLLVIVGSFFAMVVSPHWWQIVSIHVGIFFAVTAFTQRASGGRSGGNTTHAQASQHVHETDV